MTLMWPPKSPTQVLDYDVNWTLALAGDTIVSSTWVLESGSVTIVSDSFTSTVASIMIGGGVDGEVSTFTNTIVTATAQTLVQEVQLNVQLSSALSPSNLITSGTYDVSPNLGQLTMAAYQRLQIRPAAITQQHMVDAMNESNYMQASWGADGIMWWTVQQFTQPLTASVGSYTVPSQLISVLDVLIDNGSSNRLITSFSRTDFASLSNPTTEGFPTSYWYNRGLIPSLNLWPVPDGSAAYNLIYWAYTQTQDATFGNGSQPAVPNWWLDAYVSGLAHRLARIWAPALEAVREADAMKAYMIACKQIEPVPLYIMPGLSAYRGR